MRYALRNQKKITEKLGEKHLESLIFALDAYFVKNEIIEEVDGKYNVLRVPGENKICEFSIIRKTYDVYNLAFKK